MERKYIDCRAYPSEMNCTVMISADSEAELMEAAVQHAAERATGQSMPSRDDVCAFAAPERSGRGLRPVDEQADGCQGGEDCAGQKRGRCAKCAP
ncbi:MAG: hypothetical protein H6R08_1954 [Proteobacteria bacterium]|nr:hypothetical protein [Pseudomonadota bacterium]